ncbi:MAG: hypothetical protein ACRCR1_02330 [Aeromonas sp.]
MIQDNLQLFSFKFSNLPGRCGIDSGLGDNSNPADFWQIGRILLKKSGISTFFLRKKALKINKNAKKITTNTVIGVKKTAHKRKQQIRMKITKIY